MHQVINTASGRPKGTYKKYIQSKRGISFLSLTLAIWAEIIYNGGSYKGWKYYQGIIHNAYHGDNIETDHQVILLMQEDVEKKTFPMFAAPVSGMLKEIIDNNNTTRYKISLNGLGMKKIEYVVVSMMLKTGMKVAQG